MHDVASNGVPEGWEIETPPLPPPHPTMPPLPPTADVVAMVRAWRAPRKQIADALIAERTSLEARLAEIETMLHELVPQRDKPAMTQTKAPPAKPQPKTLLPDATNHVLAWLREHPGSTSGEITNGVGYVYAPSVIGALIRRGKVIAKGEKGSRRYFLR